jgi:hypothetical protein
MNREVHVGFCEGVGVKFPRATRPLIHTWLEFNLTQNMVFCLTKHSTGFLVYILLRLAHYRLRYYWKTIISKDS